VPRPAAALVASLAASVLGAGCATTRPAAPAAVTMSGAHEGKKLLVDARAVVERSGAGALTIEIENRGAEPVGLDLDAVNLQDPEGASFAPLGQLQRFRRDGQQATTRVPHGPASVEPGARRRFVLEFEKLPADRAFTVIIPAIYRLTIDGQEPMNPVGVTLAIAAAPSPAGSPDAKFFDPFVEW